VVRGTLRSRRLDNGAADASLQSRDRPWHASLPGAPPGYAGRSLHRPAAGQDPARVSHRRDGGLSRDPVYPLLRQPRTAPTLRDAARRIPTLDRRRAAGGGPLAECRTRTAPDGGGRGPSHVSPALTDR